MVNSHKPLPYPHLVVENDEKECWKLSLRAAVNYGDLMAELVERHEKGMMRIWWMTWMAGSFVGWTFSAFAIHYPRFHLFISSTLLFSLGLLLFIDVYLFRRRFKTHPLRITVANAPNGANEEPNDGTTGNGSSLVSEGASGETDSYCPERQGPIPPKG